MFKKSNLENNLTLITTPQTSTKAVTALILVGAGSRYENQKLRGISHFLEHMFFKGAKKYQNSAQVATAIDSVGGEFNAFTGKEYAGYYIKVASEHQDMALDVLSDMMIHAKFAQAEIEKERGVIIEEYNMYQDTPMYQSGWNFEYLIFGDQPMGWDQIGTKDLILSFNHQDFSNYKNQLYTPDNTVISIAGNIEENKVIDKVNSFFTFKKHQKDFNFKKLKPNHSTNRIKVTNKNTEQTHLVLGVRGYAAEHPDNYAMKLLSIILGGNMSSRMFLNVREAKGLAYYIQTTTDDYLDAGIISTRAGVDNKRTVEAITSIRDEYLKIRNEGEISEKELNKAKSYLKGKIILSLEDSEELAHLYGKQALLYKDVKNIDEILAKIDQVTTKDIARITQELFKLERMNLVIIGPYKDETEFLKLIS